jgi:hypothetical protein
VAEVACLGKLKRWERARRSLLVRELARVLLARVLVQMMPVMVRCGAQARAPAACSGVHIAGRWRSRMWCPLSWLLR